MVECTNMESPHKNAEIPNFKDEEHVPSQSHHSIEEEATENNATLDSAAELLTYYHNSGFRWIRRLLRGASQILVELHVLELIKQLRILICNHPLAAAIVALIVIACGIPIFIFLAFAIATLVFTFGSFLIIEGAVLAAGLFALLLCLSSMAVVFVTIGFIGGLLYVTYMLIESLLHVNGGSGENLQPLEAHFPEVLASIRSLPHSNWHHKGGRSSSSHSINGHTHKHHSK